MRKTLALLAFSLIFIISGCARVDDVPVSVKEKDVCVTCDANEEKRPQVPCAYKAKVVNYGNECDCSYAFPVTVRRVSSCGGGAL